MIFIQMINEVSNDPKNDINYLFFLPNKMLRHFAFVGQNYMFLVRRIIINILPYRLYEGDKRGKTERHLLKRLTTVTSEYSSLGSKATQGGFNRSLDICLFR